MLLYCSVIDPINALSNNCKQCKFVRTNGTCSRCFHACCDTCSASETGATRRHSIICAVDPRNAFSPQDFVRAEQLASNSLPEVSSVPDPPAAAVHRPQVSGLSSGRVSLPRRSPITASATFTPFAVHAVLDGPLSVIAAGHAAAENKLHITVLRAFMGSIIDAHNSTCRTSGPALPVSTGQYNRDFASARSIRTTFKLRPVSSKHCVEDSHSMCCARTETICGWMMDTVPSGIIGAVSCECMAVREVLGRADTLTFTRIRECSV
jgi:hypothetical protein